MNFSIIGSEDCLYLNVFTPHVDFSAINSNNLKAVMVWIHGGGFSSGFANTDFYGPDYLMENDVVLVSFNYRLGIFGFLNLNHPHATGNQALKDQNLVLRWVRQNIAAFGGNPNLVTIFGQSAGAVSVDLHVLSEMSAGLFSRSISMSGSPLCEQWGLQSNVEAEQEAYSVAAQLGIYAGNSQELLNAFYTIPAETFLSVTRSWPFKSNAVLRDESGIALARLGRVGTAPGDGPVSANGPSAHQSERGESRGRRPRPILSIERLQRR
ncbi:unnamed protein product [Trichogramma brassicae]|uniref:Carboxylic ester hydrolase n=1 Tax=Trichogramma brassicae TaxID=86971 RepID=A0A6H5IWJ4_9HYME|nr:unnamed protein product [Trichogramma brassicae]